MKYDCIFGRFFYTFSQYKKNEISISKFIRRLNMFNLCILPIRPILARFYYEEDREFVRYRFAYTIFTEAYYLEHREMVDLLILYVYFILAKYTERVDYKSVGCHKYGEIGGSWLYRYVFTGDWGTEGNSTYYQKPLLENQGIYALKTRIKDGNGNEIYAIQLVTCDGSKRFGVTNWFYYAKIYLSYKELTKNLLLSGNKL